MIKIMTVFGTRPEAIKMCPVISELKKEVQMKTIVSVTAQHRQMLDQVLTAFNIIPDYDLNIMKNKQSLVDITCNVINHLDDVVKKEKPDLILVHGDTTTTMASGIVAFYNKVALGHIEAGLRTNDKYAPFPEEMNRRITGTLADLHFCPTEQAKQNLLSEGKSSKNIFVTGNTVIDALQQTIKAPFSHPVLDDIFQMEKKTQKKQRIVLLTTHRRENLGSNMVNIFSAVKQITEHLDNLHVIFPVHLNPAIQNLSNEMLSGNRSIHLIPPLDVISFHHLESRADLILTDSGGVQEEAPSFNVPVLVLRDRTERPEGVTSGALKLVGTDQNVILTTALDLLTNKEHYNKMANSKNPYGDGHASERIVKVIKNHFQL
ncbi:UDP-N-acetylglucosamine 2-epimerase (non-hydrolyzing) [Sporolactobacillus sp. CPB3-1]|uniref:UDP-N-acetylglucosamine 2-epimerase (non-hydrolyzing) n=1 Tax=Sporolactobacillus mangiferae TaxID=2940498 RepID=A0ABT0M7X3_9BACL|nr:UDP-N-acetylglucosamine 2-epimerase (non-hydrolyzing) [Sporolactobacillus mangiferae]MCL1630475.1 UDP-N-acetylglucosamine 2-epimerase (non-hydrolyzing) [Sporolactobacillus mangiferae]